jgi:hypothetical protein
MKARPSAMLRAGASWKRSSLSFSSAPASVGRTNVVPARPSGHPESVGADSNRAVKNPSGLNSAAKARSSNRNNRCRKGNSARAGGDAVGAAAPVHSLDQARPPELHSGRSRIRCAHRGLHNSLALPEPKIRRRAAVKVPKVVAGANDDSVAGAAEGVAGARHRRSHQRSDAMDAALRGGATSIPSRSRSRRD